MRFSRILGTGSYLPQKVLTNHDLEKMMETSHDWIVERTGIHRRHLVAESESVDSMAEMAARRALQAAELKPEDLDMIIVATVTTHMAFPSAACLLQARLGVKDIPAFDISAACAGFNYLLSIADQYIKTGAAKNILIVGSETLSRVVDWEDRRTCVLFGDGAGAAIMGPSEEAGVIATYIHADGNYQDLLSLYNNYGSLAERHADKSSYVGMQGNALFRVAVNTLSRLFDETLEKSGIDRKDVDWLVPHQANIRIIMAMARKLNVSEDHVVLTVAEHANTSSASIPLALDTAVRDGRIKRGDMMLLEGFGGGLAWGSALIRY